MFHVLCMQKIDVEYFFEILLIEVLLNAQGGHIFNKQDENSTLNAREKSYIYNVQQYLSKNVLGSEESVAQFQIPLEKQKGSSTKNIGIVNIENYQMRKIIEKLDHPADISIVDSDRKGKWKCGS